MRSAQRRALYRSVGLVFALRGYASAAQADYELNPHRRRGGGERLPLPASSVVRPSWPCSGAPGSGAGGLGYNA